MTAYCPGCGLAHPNAGLAHMDAPWRITPRCKSCVSVLVLPSAEPVLRRVSRRSRDRRIQRLWPSDLTLPQIGMEVGASKDTVRRAAHRMGLPSRAHRSNWRAA